MTKYGVLLIGGNRTHQEGYADSFAAHPLCRLVAVTDEIDVSEYRAGLNRALADRLDIPYIDDLDAALARDDVDIVSMCADVERRGRVAVKCAQAGKHIYLDKPLCANVEDADAIVKAIEEVGIASQMMTQTFTTWAQSAKKLLDSGRLGELKAIHGEELFSKGRAGSVPHGTVRREHERPERFTYVESKREMFDVSVYVISMIRWLTGLKTESVYCLTGNYFFAEHERNDVEDFGALLTTLEGGLTASCVSGRYGWSTHASDGIQRLFFVGTEGTAMVDANTPRMEVYNDEPNFQLPPRHPYDPMGMWGSTFDGAHQAIAKNRWIPLPVEQGFGDGAPRSA